MSICVSIYLSLCLSISIYLSLYLSLYQSIYLPIYLSLLSISLSIYLPTYLHISPWQVHHFPSRVSTARPPVALLLDCSELELARTLGARRGRLDDTKEAVARRLQTYRQDRV